MMVVGVVEIVAGVAVASQPGFAGYLVSAWPVCIIINLVLAGGYLDVALRDLGLALGTLALGLAEAEVRVEAPARA